MTVCSQSYSPIFSIGHSNLSIERFRDILRLHKITAVADVRSRPYSRFNPWFGKDALRAHLKDDKVAYVFLGKELGGRPKRENLMRDGVADYEAMAQTSNFASGISRVLKGSEKYSIALMCAEKDPLDCHRCLLVARKLAEFNTCIQHIHLDGAVESHDEAEIRLLSLEGLPVDDLLWPLADRINIAYQRRNLAVGYSEKDESDA